jgi:hypothetical protein
MSSFNASGYHGRPVEWLGSAPLPKRGHLASTRPSPATIYAGSMTLDLAPESAPTFGARSAGSILHPLERSRSSQAIRAQGRSGDRSITSTAPETESPGTVPPAIV